MSSAVDFTNPVISAEDFARKMEEIRKNDDTESRHGEADALMVRTLRGLGYGEGCDIFDEMPRWYA